MGLGAEPSKLSLTEKAPKRKAPSVSTSAFVFDDFGSGSLIEDGDAQGTPDLHC